MHHCFPWNWWTFSIAFNWRKTAGWTAGCLYTNRPKIVCTSNGGIYLQTVGLKSNHFRVFDRSTVSLSFQCSRIKSNFFKLVLLLTQDTLLKVMATGILFEGWLQAELVRRRLFGLQRLESQLLVLRPGRGICKGCSNGLRVPPSSKPHIDIGWQ